MLLASILVPFALLSSAVTSPAPAQDKIWKNVYEKAKKAVVTIKTDVALGSGFVVSVTKNSNYTPKWPADFKRLNESLLKNVKAENCTFVITALHVLKGMTTLEIVPNTGKSVKNPIIYGYDSSRDIVVLLARTDMLTGTLPLGDYSKVDVGDPIAVVGNPLGFLPGTLSTGIVSAKRNADGVPLLQHTASISEGSSGSPVLNKSGQVIGMVTGSFEEGQSLNIAVGSGPLKTAVVNTDRVFADYSSLKENSDTLTGGDHHRADPKFKEKNNCVGELTQLYCARALTWNSIRSNVKAKDEEVIDFRDKFLDLLDLDHAEKQFRESGANDKEVVLFRKEIELVRSKVKKVAETEIAWLAEARVSDESKKADDLFDKTIDAQLELEDALLALGDSFEDTWYDFTTVSELLSGVVLYEIFSEYKLPVAPDINAKECKIDFVFKDDFEKGDVITNIKLSDGTSRKIESWKDLWRVLGEPDEVEVTVLRKGKSLKVKTSIY